jgi:primosomal protein N'
VELKPARMTRARTARRFRQLAKRRQVMPDMLAASQPFLLHGVTGSGKTEVYLRLVEQTIARGQASLILVPEIALTPQLEGARAGNRFPRARVVSLHSAWPRGRAPRVSCRRMEGRADIVLGTRLSVFTPLPRLGLIVVDEEHDASYKQHEGVRYSAAIWPSGAPAAQRAHRARLGHAVAGKLARRQPAATGA